MGNCKHRNAPFDKELDALDLQIATLIAKRIELMERADNEYDCCGEGEAYFSVIKDEYAAERIFHAISGVE